MEHTTPQKKQAQSDNLSEKQSRKEQNSEKTFEDARPSTIRQRELQEIMVQNPAQDKATQLKTIINNSSRINKAAQLQSAITSGPVVQKAKMHQTGIDNSPFISVQQNRIQNLYPQPVQKKRQEEEELPVQKKEGASVQGNTAGTKTDKSSNQNGLPEDLKSGIENLSGVSMDDVKVQHNSSKPEQLNAHAYAQGSEIHLGPGQEQHLPHEAWHVVQQKQGRVKPTTQLKEIQVNDDSALEKEADMMGGKAASFSGPQAKQLKRISISGPVVQGKMKADNFTSLILEQQQIQNKVKADPDAYQGQYTTVGYEHEFAQMKDGPLKGVSHLEIAKTALKMPITGLPFILETDASDALELVTPPFLIETINGKPIPDPDEIDKVDKMIQATLLAHVTKEPNIQQLIDLFVADPGVNFVLKNVQIERKNMTPRTQDTIFNKLTSNKAKVSKDTLSSINLTPSKKGAKKDEDVHISTHVNFATDAETYDKMQDLFKGGAMDDSMTGYTEVQENFKTLLFTKAFTNDEVKEGEDKARKGMEVTIDKLKEGGITSADTLTRTLSAELKDLIDQTTSYDTSSKEAVKREKIRKTLYQTRPVHQSKEKFTRSITANKSKISQLTSSHAEINLALDTILNDFINLQAELEKVKQECDQKEDPFFDYAGPIKECKALVPETSVITGSSNPNLKIFLNSLARTLSGLFAVPAIKDVEKAQKDRYKDPKKSMDVVDDKTTLTSRVKDVKQVWIKDSIMNIGLGVLKPKDWFKVHQLVTDDGLIGEACDIASPTFDRMGLDKDAFRRDLLNAFAQISNDIKSNKLDQRKTNTDKLFLNPKDQPKLFSHDPKYIGPRQDTYIPAKKVQMPEIWKDTRLHVVESRKDTVATLRELQKGMGLTSGKEDDKSSGKDSLSDLKNKKLDDSDSSFPDGLPDLEPDEPGFDKVNNESTFKTIQDEFHKNYPGAKEGPQGVPEGVVHPSNKDSDQGTGKGVISEERTLIALNNFGLEDWLKQQGIKVASNKGRGCNCLIISLLQHATGNYNDEHHAKAKEYREKLILNNEGVVEGEMLHSDNPAFMWLVNEMNNDFGLSMNVMMVHSDENGLPYIGPVHTKGTDNVMIWDKGGHFEALYKEKK